LLLVSFSVLRLNVLVAAAVAFKEAVVSEFPLVVYNGNGRVTAAMSFMAILAIMVLVI
jgi:hypothetical protein